MQDGLENSQAVVLVHQHLRRSQVVSILNWRILMNFPALCLRVSGSLMQDVWHVSLIFRSHMVGMTTFSDIPVSKAYSCWISPKRSDTIDECQKKMQTMTMLLFEQRHWFPFSSWNITYRLVLWIMPLNYLRWCSLETVFQRSLPVAEQRPLPSSKPAAMTWRNRLVS